MSSVSKVVIFHFPDGEKIGKTGRSAHFQSQVFIIAPPKEPSEENQLRWDEMKTRNTPLKTKISPEIWWLEDEISL